MSKLISGRVKKTTQSGITSDRYEFLGLEQAEPDLGDPTVGVSSIGANPHPPGEQYLLANVEGQTGKRYWISVNQLQFGTREPGTFTIFNNNVQIGIANSFNVFNFVGTGVTVDPVGPNVEDQTGIATVRISVLDLKAPGNEYQIPYHDPVTGFLQGSSNFVYRDGRVGIGSTIPLAKLNVVGDTIITGITTLGTLKISSGIVTATSGIITYYGDFVGTFVGAAATASFATTSFNLTNAGNILSGTISSSRLSGSYGISITGSASTASFATTAFNLVGTASTASFATTAFNLEDAAGITTGTIDRARLSGDYDINITGTAQSVIQIVDQVVNASSLSVSGISTFNGFVGIATTTTDVALVVENYALKTNQGSFTASPGVENPVDLVDMTIYDFKTTEYTFHFEYQNYIQSQKLLVMQNNTSAYGQEYAIMYHPTKIASLSASISYPYCYINIIPEQGISGIVTYRFVRGSLL